MKNLSLCTLALLLILMCAFAQATEPIHGGTGSVVTDLAGTESQVTIEDNGDGTATAGLADDTVITNSVSAPVHKFSEGMLPAAISGIGQLAVNSMDNDLYFMESNGDVYNISEPPVAVSSNYYLTNSPSADIGTYNLMTSDFTQVNTTVINNVTTVAASGEVIYNSVTVSGIPSIVVVPDGIGAVHFHAKKASGSKTVTLRGDIYKRATSGIETLMATSDDSVVLNGDFVFCNLQFTMSGQTIESADRLVLYIVATVTGVGGNPVVHIQMEGSTQSHITFPSSSLSAENFVPYAGAIKDIITTHEILANSTSTDVLDIAETAGVLTKAGYGRIYVNSVDGRAYLRNTSGADVDLTVQGDGAASVDAYNIMVMSYTGDQFDASGKVGDGRAMTITNSGADLFIADTTSDEVYRWSLDPPYNVSSASFVQNIPISDEDSVPTGLHFSTDGHNLFMLGATNKSVFQYYMPVPYQITGMGLVNSFSVNAEDATPSAMSFNAAGTKMGMAGETNDSVFSYSLTAWDIDTASYDTKSCNVTAKATNPAGLAISANGSKFITIDADVNAAVLYNLGTDNDVSTCAWGLSGATFVDTDPQDLAFSENGYYLFIMGKTDGIVRKWITNLNYTAE